MLLLIVCHVVRRKADSSMHHDMQCGFEARSPHGDRGSCLWQRLRSWPCNRLLAGQTLTAGLRGPVLCHGHLQAQSCWNRPGTAFHQKNSYSKHPNHGIFLHISFACWVIAPSQGLVTFPGRRSLLAFVSCAISPSKAPSLTCTKWNPAAPKQTNLKSISYLLAPCSVWSVICWGNWESAISSTCGKVTGKLRCSTRAGSTCLHQRHSCEHAFSQRGGCTPIFQINPLQTPKTHRLSEDRRNSISVKVCTSGKGRELTLWTLFCGRRTRLVSSFHTGVGASYMEATSEEENHINVKNHKNNVHGTSAELCSSLLLWRYSRPAWTRFCAACSRWPCFGRRVGLDDPQRSLPTPTILWFCDSVTPVTSSHRDAPQGPVAAVASRLCPTRTLHGEQTGIVLGSERKLTTAASLFQSGWVFLQGVGNAWLFSCCREAPELEYWLQGR